MPLSPGSDRATISQNIREFHTGKTYAHTAGKFGKERADKQAIAVALNEARKSRAYGGVAGYDDGGGVGSDATGILAALSTPGGMTALQQGLTPDEIIGAGNPMQPSYTPGARRGGGVRGYDAGGTVDPVQQIIQALQQGSGSGVGASGAPGPPVPGATNPAQPSSVPATNATSPTGVASTTTTPTTPQQMGVAAAATPTATATPVNPMGKTLMKEGGVVPAFADGGFNVLKGPNLRPPFYERQAQRQLHVGPVLSNVPGRTDNHQVRVPAGSYVLPAAHVASMGHGNTNAGLAAAQKMFGSFGAGAARIPHGSLPRPPKPMTNYAAGGASYSEGGARGADAFHPVDVDISGGEFVIPPWAIIARYGSLKHGHQILDHWVMNLRKKEIETQRKLPPPAKKADGGAVILPFPASWVGGGVGMAG